MLHILGGTDSKQSCGAVRADSGAGPAHERVAFSFLFFSFQRSFNARTWLWFCLQSGKFTVSNSGSRNSRTFPAQHRELQRGKKIAEKGKGKEADIAHHSVIGHCRKQPKRDGDDNRAHAPTRFHTLRLACLPNTPRKDGRTGLGRARFTSRLHATAHHCTNPSDLRGSRGTAIRSSISQHYHRIPAS